ncbi:hypothetical protein AAZX31_02G158800 [Glycine max]
MHVCFIDICFYLEGFNFICCYACFLLNNSYFSLLIFQFCFWFLFILSGYRRRSIQQWSKEAWILRQDVCAGCCSFGIAGNDPKVLAYTGNRYFHEGHK